MWPWAPWTLIELVARTVVGQNAGKVLQQVQAEEECALSRGRRDDCISPENSEL